jgi:hypothetical protein
MSNNMKPIIRELDSGDVVVDFGSYWFVCKTGGEVITKFVSGHKIKTRPANPKERVIALGHAAFDPVTH